MNTQASAVTGTDVESQAVAPLAISGIRLMYWSVRRELWENRYIYLAPLAIAGLFLLGFLITTIHLPARMRAAMALDPMQQHQAVALPYDIVAGLMMASAMLVGAFYCLDALYGERRSEQCAEKSGDLHGGASYRLPIPAPVNVPTPVFLVREGKEEG